MSCGFFSTLFGQKPDCSAVKTGEFYVKDSKNAPTLIVINRTDASQTETIVKTNKVLNYTINWLKACQFVLQPTDNDTTRRTVVTIQKVKKDYYEMKATMLLQPVVYGKIYRK